MKKILIFSMTYEPYCGGAEVAIREICDRLDPAQYEIDLIALRVDERLPKQEKIGNVNVYRVGPAVSPEAIVGKGNELMIIPDNNLPFSIKFGKAIFPLLSWRLGSKLHKEKHYDLTWAMMASQAAIGATLFKWQHPEVPYFLELQDGKSLQGLRARWPWLKLIWGLYEKVYTKADLVKAISYFLKDIAREANYTREVVVIPNAVNVEKFSKPTPEAVQRELKEKYQKGEDDIFLFTASRLVLSRGVEEVIRALPYLPEHVKFLVAGAGEGLNELKKIAEESGVGARVIWAGHQGHYSLPAHLHISDIFVRPSLFEGLGNSFLEAMAAGIPIVGTPVGGIPDFLFDPREGAERPTGVFCQVKDPESLAKAIEYLLQNPAMKAQIVENARALVSEKYEWDLVAKDMEDKVFDKLA